MPPLYVVLHDPEFSANEESWLIKELVPTPSITLLASPPKAGKTVFATALAVAVATGQPFLGHEVAQGPVLWIAGDETRAERRRVLDQIPYPDGPYPIPAAVENHSPGPRAIPLYTCYSGLNITGDFFRQEVSDLCRMLQPKLLVLDPLLTMIARQDLSRDHQARQALDLGFHLAFGGVITFKTAETMREAARITPAERLLTETDAPYLAPIPWRGKRNEPSFMTETVKTLAAVRGTTPDAIAETASANFEGLCLRPRNWNRYTGGSHAN